MAGTRSPVWPSDSETLTETEAQLKDNLMCGGGGGGEREQRTSG